MYCHNNISDTCNIIIIGLSLKYVEFVMCQDVQWKIIDAYSGREQTNNKYTVKGAIRAEGRKINVDCYWKIISWEWENCFLAKGHLWTQIVFVKVLTKQAESAFLLFLQEARP